MTSIQVIHEGHNENNPDRPFTIVFVGNPVLGVQSGGFVTDPIIDAKPDFDECVEYSTDCLYGHLPGQREQLLGSADIRQCVRVVSVFETGLPAIQDNCLVNEMSGVLAPVQVNMAPHLAKYEILADIVFAVTSSAESSLSAAYDTRDNESAGGVEFRLDSSYLLHAYYCSEPGCVALHSTERDLTPLHEFQHALGSFSNGQIEDLYHDSGGRGLNKKKLKHGSSIPTEFSEMNGTRHRSDLTRDSLGYPRGWRTYHCEPHNPSSPVVMDNYFLAGNSLDCENDKVTRRFLQDRVRVKMLRP